MIRLGSIILALLAIAIIVALSLRNRKRLKLLHWRKLIVLIASIVAMLLFSFIPSPFYSTGDEISNRDILFVVDLTYSMNAEDSHDGLSRIEAVKKDIVSIAERSQGSRYAIFTFDSKSETYLPFTSTLSDLSVASQTLFTKDYYGSQTVMKMSDALTNAAKYLRDSSQVDKTRQKMMVLMSDFELTNKQESIGETVTTAKKIKADVGGATLIGYGADGGSSMPRIQFDFKTKSLVRDEFTDTVKDIDENGNYGDVKTKRVQENGRQLATALNGKYLASENSGELDAAIKASASTALNRQLKTPESRALRQNNLYVFVAFGILVWLIVTEILRTPAILTRVAASRSRKAKS